MGTGCGFLGTYGDDWSISYKEAAAELRQLFSPTVRDSQCVGLTTLMMQEKDPYQRTDGQTF
jgi:hypothetical protein